MSSIANVWPMILDLRILDLRILDLMEIEERLSALGCN
jgi:hypothetical protein